MPNPCACWRSGLELKGSKRAGEGGGRDFVGLLRVSQNSGRRHDIFRRHRLRQLPRLRRIRHNGRDGFGSSQRPRLLGRSPCAQVVGNSALSRHHHPSRECTDLQLALMPSRRNGDFVVDMLIGSERARA